MAKKQCNTKSSKSSSKVDQVMSQIENALQAVDETKDEILETWANQSIPKEIKTKKLEELRVTLRRGEEFAHSLMRKEIASYGARDQKPCQAEGSERVSYFQWTDPATTEDAFKQVQAMVPMLDEMKARIAAVELDRTIPLSAKATKLREMKACLESVQLRIVELSERYLQTTNSAA